jgi:hypothetical protein
MFRTYRPHGLPQRKFYYIILGYTNKLPLRKAVGPIRTEHEVIVCIAQELNQIKCLT